PSESHAKFPPLRRSHNVVDNALATAVARCEIPHPEDLSNRSRLVDRLLPTRELEPTILDVRTEFDVLRVEEPDRVSRGITVEDHVDSTEPDFVEAGISDHYRFVALLGLENL